MATNCNSHAKHDDLGHALELHRAGHLAQAAAVYANIPEGDPRTPSALYVRAGIALRLDGLATALQLVARAAQLDGVPLIYDAAAPAYVALADNLREARRLGEALACYEIALQLDVELVAAHLGLGLVYADSGHMLQATSCFQNALRLDSNCVPALLNLGTAWRHLG